MLYYFFAGNLSLIMQEGIFLDLEESKFMQGLYSYVSSLRYDRAPRTYLATLLGTTVFGRRLPRTANPKTFYTTGSPPSPTTENQTYIEFLEKTSSSRQTRHPRVRVLHLNVSFTYPPPPSSPLFPPNSNRGLISLRADIEFIQ